MQSSLYDWPVSLVINNSWNFAEDLVQTDQDTESLRKQIVLLYIAVNVLFSVFKKNFVELTNLIYKHLFLYNILEMVEIFTCKLYKDLLDFVEKPLCAFIFFFCLPLPFPICCMIEHIESWLHGENMHKFFTAFKYLLALLQQFGSVFNLIKLRILEKNWCDMESQCPWCKHAYTLFI